MKFKVARLIVCSLLLAHIACQKGTPEYPRPQPQPEPIVTYGCANTNDIFKLLPDSFVVNKHGEMYAINEDKVYDIVAYSQFALGACTGKHALLAQPINSPLAVRVRTETGQDKPAIAVSSGNIYIREVISEMDVARITENEAGEWGHFEMAMINFNQDTIQSNTLAILFDPEFQKP